MARSAGARTGADAVSPPATRGASSVPGIAASLLAGSPDMSAILLIDTLVVIAHVSVLPMDRERLLLDQTVVIRGERIAAVGPSGRTPIPSGSRLIDGAGLTLLPGLADMHVHITPADFPALLVNGVTLVRELNGSPDHLRWRAEVDRGER